MTNPLRTAWSAYLDQQHRSPTGLVGQLIGQRMARQHAPETAWSIDLLDLQPVDRVLEIGFGAGQALALALARGPGRVVGVDTSATMIRAAARRNRAAIMAGRLTLLRGDVAALPLHGQCFDKIVTVHTFYFWPDPRAVLEQLIGLLAPADAVSQPLPRRAPRQPASACSGRSTSRQPLLCAS